MIASCSHVGVVKQGGCITLFTSFDANMDKTVNVSAGTTAGQTGDYASGGGMATQGVYGSGDTPPSALSAAAPVGSQLHHMPSRRSAVETSRRSALCLHHNHID